MSFGWLLRSAAAGLQLANGLELMGVYCTNWRLLVLTGAVYVPGVRVWLRILQSRVCGWCWPVRLPRFGDCLPCWRRLQLGNKTLLLSLVHGCVYEFVVNDTFPTSTGSEELVQQSVTLAGRKRT